MSVNTKVNGQLVPSAGLYKKSTPMSVATCYSEEERKIGVWINNKPLYQKTIELGTMPNNTTKNVAHNIANLDEVVSFQGYYKNPVSGGIIPLSFTHKSSIGEQLQLSINSTNVSIITAVDKSSLTDCYVTLQYTKTTDNVTVSTYAPIVPMNIASKYSLEEKVVGQWIDHKPLYSKTVDLGTLSASSNKTVLYANVGISNIETVAYFDVIVNNQFNSNFNRPDNSNAEFYTQLVETGIFIRTYNNAITSAYATLLYTKTTDTAGTGLYSDDEATLGMLGDVDLENLADGDIIRYNGTSGKFENVGSGVGYLNVSDVITTLTGAGTSSFATYTATKNCYVVGTIQGDSTSGAPAVQIDSITVAYISTTNTTIGVMIPVKKGQVVGYRMASTSTLTVYGMTT